MDSDMREDQKQREGEKKSGEAVRNILETELKSQPAAGVEGKRKMKIKWEKRYLMKMKCEDR